MNSCKRIKDSIENKFEVKEDKKNCVRKMRTRTRPGPYQGSDGIRKAKKKKGVEEE